MTKAANRYWLVKTEPSSFSLEDLANAPNKTTCWDGVRNYQARNLIRDEMKKGQLVLFYHSNADPSAIVGVAKVVRESYPDPTAWDQTNDHFDPKSVSDNPRWFMVDLKFAQAFARALTLEELRKVRSLRDMELLRVGSRLSVQPVRPEEFKTILKMSEVK